MKIGFNNENPDVWTGYGHAATKITNTLILNDFDVAYDRKDADIEIFFGHPKDYTFISDDSIHIGYTAWESTNISNEWKEKLKTIDELWVANDFCKDVFSKFYDGNIVVLPHGVDKVFTPQKRSFDGTLKFLHIGYPALRKNLYDTVNAFLELYSGRKDVTLTIKTYGGEIDLAEYQGIDNINIIAETYTSFELVNLMTQHHCLIYPSLGEGFGLIPLQALATGLPCIITDGWCDYINFAEDLKIDSKLEHNRFTVIHPGLMFNPNYNTILEKMRYVEERTDFLLQKYYYQAQNVIETYDWNKILVPHFEDVKKRFNL